MGIKPIEIKRLGTTGIRIQWDNGSECSLNSEALRRACPCASCREARGEGSHEKPISPPAKKSLLTVVSNSRDEELRLDNIWAVGQYAIGMQWGDGHTTGIYTYDYLHYLGEQQQQSETGI